MLFQSGNGSFMRVVGLILLAAGLMGLAACDPGTTPTATPPPSTPTNTVPPTDRPPIILVHGWKGSPNPLDFLACQAMSTPVPLPTDPADFPHFEENVAPLGYTKVYRAQLLSSPCFTPRMAQNIPYLRAAIAQALTGTKQSQVIIIAHSMGGVIAREYIEDTSLYQNDVCALITLGSPHRGVDISANYLGSLLAPLGMGVEFYIAKQEVMTDFLRVTMDTYNRNHGWRSGLPYYLINGDLRLQDRTILGQLIYLLSGGLASDGFVAVQSGAALRQGTPVPAGVSVTRVPSIPEAHSTSLGNPHYFSTPTSQTQDYVLNILRAGITCGVSSNTLPTGAGRLIVATAAQPAPPQPICDAGRLTQLLAQYRQESQLPFGTGDDQDRLALLFGQYLQDCPNKDGVTSAALAETALSNTLQINTLRIQATDVQVVFTDTNKRTLVVEPDGTIKNNIPGTKALRLPEGEIDIFYPPQNPEVRIEPRSRAPNRLPIAVNVIQVKGTSKATTEKFEFPAVIRPDDLYGILSPEARPDFVIYPLAPNLPTRPVLPTPLPVQPSLPRPLP